MENEIKYIIMNETDSSLLGYLTKKEDAEKFCFLNNAYCFFELKYLLVGEVKKELENLKLYYTYEIIFSQFKNVLEIESTDILIIDKEKVRKSKMFLIDGNRVKIRLVASFSMSKKQIDSVAEEIIIKLMQLRNYKSIKEFDQNDYDCINDLLSFVVL